MANSYIKEWDVSLEVDPFHDVAATLDISVGVSVIDGALMNELQKALATGSDASDSLIALGIVLGNTK